MQNDDANLLEATTLNLIKDDAGRLDLEYPAGSLHDIYLVPCFPLSRRGQMVSVRNQDGDEVALLDDLERLPPEARGLAVSELDRSYFMPRITSVLHAEEKLNVLTMDIETDRGERTIQVRNPRRRLRKLPGNRIIVHDADGNRYEIRRLNELSTYAQDALGQYL